MNLQPIAARTSTVGFTLSALVGLTACLGTRASFWDYTVGLWLVVPCVVIGLVGLTAGLAWVVLALIRNSSDGARWGLIGLIGAAIVVGVPSFYARMALSAPPIHDISTDIEYAPPFKALVALRKGAANGPQYDGPKLVTLSSGKVTTVTALQKKYYGDIIPFAQFIKPVKLFWRALNLANRMGWHVVAFDARDGRIEATDTTFWFGFTDDLVIRVRPAGKLGARLDIRSKSRVGDSDFGRNAARLRTFLKTLKTMG